ncbi:MAG: heparinase II/III family protein, partial [Planctomycetota bacterium]
DLSPWRGAQPGLLWFARRISNPAAAVDLEAYVDLVLHGSDKEQRFFSFSMLWWPDWTKADVTKAPPPLSWSGGGPVPVALFRGSWDDPNTMFVGVKGGVANANHAHMDNGTFVLTANGVRWVQDLGGEHYEPIRKAGFDLFRMRQGSDRWKLLRHHNLYHNTITLDRQEHLIEGQANFLKFEAEVLAERVGRAVVDLSETLRLPEDGAIRTVTFDSMNQVVRVEDRLRKVKRGTQVDWTLMVFGDEKQLSDDGRSVTLRHDGHALQIDLLEPEEVRFQMAPAVGKHPAEAENPGIDRLWIEFESNGRPTKIDVELTVVE